MSAAPAATPVTAPGTTVATDVLDDCQVAVCVTFWTVPSAIVAVAVNGDVIPTMGAVPLTARARTFEDDVDDDMTMWVVPVHF
jgi:hypothetical protein